MKYCDGIPTLVSAFYKYPHLIYYVADKKLSDKTEVNEITGQTWKDFREKAMDKDYKKEKWWLTLIPDKKELIEQLRMLQETQGDMKELKPKQYKLHL